MGGEKGRLWDETPGGEQVKESSKLSKGFICTHGPTVSRSQSPQVSKSPGPNVSASPRRVLGIIGSQRRLGNCELFVKEVSRNIPAAHELRLVRLPSLRILPCKGCYRCIEQHTCSIEDDVPFLLREISSCDALVIASPVYFFGAHSSIKQLLDRAFAFFTTTEAMERKPAILANMYGMKDRIGVAPQALLTLASFLCLDVKASVTLRAALPGEVLTQSAHRKTAARLGRLLFRKGAQKATQRGCPFCGNEIVRMRKTDLVCTLCHSSFRLNQDGKAVKKQVGLEVGDIGAIRAHREWLRGMKNRFLARKKELLEMSLPYKDMGQWIRPDTP